MSREVICVEKDAIPAMIAQTNNCAAAMGIAEYRAQVQVSIYQHKKNLFFKTIICFED